MSLGHCFLETIETYSGFDCDISSIWSHGIFLSRQLGEQKKEVVCLCNPLSILLVKVYTVKKPVVNSRALAGLNFEQNLVNHSLISFSAVEMLT